MHQTIRQNSIPVHNFLAFALSENKWKIPKNNLMKMMYDYSISLINSGYKLNIQFKRLPSVGWWSSDINDEIQFWIQNRIIADEKMCFVIYNKESKRYLKRIVDSFPDKDTINEIIGENGSARSEEQK